MNALNARPTLDDFIDFFGAAPEWVEDGGWYYGARFVVVHGPDQLAVTVAPDDLYMVVVWKQGDATRLTLELTMVAAWTIECNGPEKHLLVRVNTGPDAICAFEFCLIRLRPTIEVECRMKWGPGWETSERSE